MLITPSGNTVRLMPVNPLVWTPESGPMDAWLAGVETRLLGRRADFYLVSEPYQPGSGYADPEYRDRRVFDPAMLVTRRHPPAAG